MYLIVTLYILGEIQYYNHLKIRVVIQLKYKNYLIFLKKINNPKLHKHNIIIL